MIYGPAFPKSRDELRENLFRLFQRSYAAAAPHGQGLAVVRSSAELYARLAAEDWAQRTIYRDECALVRRFLAESRLPLAPGAVLPRSLALHALAATWRRLLQELPRAQFDALATAEGGEHLRAALAAGRGAMIVHSHTLFAPLFWTWLGHQGIAPGVIIGHWAWQQKLGPGERQDPKRWVPEVAREMHAAAAALRDGGLVHVFGDGIQGSRALELEFCGRRRGFRPTFAELARGAPVLTAAVAVGADAAIAISIEPPLAAGAAPAQVGEYAARLAARWRRDPAQLPWNDMVNHLRFPAA